MVNAVEHVKLTNVVFAVVKVKKKVLAIVSETFLIVQVIVQQHQR